MRIYSYWFFFIPFFNWLLAFDFELSLTSRDLDLLKNYSAYSPPSREDMGTLKQKESSLKVALLLEAYSHQKEGDIQKAIETWYQIKILFKNDPVMESRSYLSLAYLYEIEGEMEKAIQYIDKAISLDKNHIKNYEYKGDILLESFLCKEAIVQYNFVLKLKRNIYKKRAKAYMCLGQDKKALIDLKKGLEREGEDIDMLNYIGLLLLFKGDKELEVARDYFIQSLSYKKNDLALYGMANYFFIKERYVESLAWINEALDIQEVNDYQLLRVRIYYMLSMFKELKEDVQIILENPKYQKIVEETLHIHEQYAYSLYYLKDYTEALEVFSNLIGYNPKEYLYFRFRGNSYFYLQMIGNALRDFDEAIDLKGDEIDYFNRVYSWVTLGEMENVLFNLNEVIRKNKKSDKAYLLRIKVYLSQYNPQKALKDINHYISFFDKNLENGEILFLKGFTEMWIKNESGDISKSIYQAIELGFSIQDWINTTYAQYLIQNEEVKKILLKILKYVIIS